MLMGRFSLCFFGAFWPVGRVGGGKQRETKTHALCMHVLSIVLLLPN